MVFLFYFFVFFLLFVGDIMVNVTAFFDSPSAEFLDDCTKDQLLEIGRHYDIEIDGKRLKENFKAILITTLTEKGVFLAKPSVSLSDATLLPSGLTFEQQNEVLRLQFKIEQVKLEAIRESRCIDVAVGAVSGSSADAFDVVGNLRLLPVFSESDTDSFFFSFSSVWPTRASGIVLRARCCCSVSLWAAPRRLCLRPIAGITLRYRRLF